MALPDVNPKQEASAVPYRKLLYLLSGKTGDHQQQVSLTGYSGADATLRLRNRGGTGMALECLDSTGSGTIFRVQDGEILAPHLTFQEQSSAPTPSSGRSILYVGTDDQLYLKNDAGAIVTINGVSYGRNYLVNPGFEVWSRGAGAFTADGAWTADKWQLSEGAGATTSISRAAASETSSQYALAWSHANAGANSLVSQALENPTSFLGRTVTFSMRVKTAYASAVRLLIGDGVTSASSSYHTGGNTYETLSATLTVAMGASSLTCSLQLVTGAQTHTGEADNAVLSITSAAIAYEPLPAAEERQRCRRYYQVCTFLQTGRAYDGANTVLSASTALSPPMSPDAAPTVTQNLDVVTLDGATASFTHTATAASASGDSYGYHTLTTTWTRAANTENARINGYVVVEVRV